MRSLVRVAILMFMVMLVGAMPLAAAPGGGQNDEDELPPDVCDAQNFTPGDTDGDGLENTRECQLGTSHLNADTDGDNLTDGEEYMIGTNPLSKYTDGDAMPDWCEFYFWNKVMMPLDPRVTDPDSDGDRIPDARETRAGLNPNRRDTDDDMLPDDEEWPDFDCHIGGKTEGPRLALDPDWDDDGIDDGVEKKSLGTKFYDSDTDDDKYGDGGEVYTYGTDPLDANDHPNPASYPPDHP